MSLPYLFVKSRGLDMTGINLFDPELSTLMNYFEIFSRRGTSQKRFFLQ